MTTKIQLDGTRESDNMCVQPLVQSSRVGAITSNPWGQQHNGGFVGYYSHLQSGHADD